MLKQASQGKMMMGTVVSDKMDKTIVIMVERKFSHRKFKKVVKRTKKFKCHDEKNSCVIGDIVSVKEIRPLSKEKRWSLVQIIKRTNPDIEKKE